MFEVQPDTNALAGAMIMVTLYQAEDGPATGQTQLIQVLGAAERTTDYLGLE